MNINSDRKQKNVDNVVLIVDDSVAIRRTLVKTFRSDGFSCGEAENGREAIEIARRIDPDIITLDLSMPVMNGLEVATELRKILPDTPIILFTLYADPLLEEHAFKAGINLLLSKSAPVTTLINKAHELIGK